MVIMMIAEMEDDDKAYMLTLYKGYYGLVRKTIYNITHDADNLDDLINDTFLKLIKKIPLIRTLENYKTAAYVVYTSRSVAINFVKRRGVQNKYVYFGEDTDLAEKIPGVEDTIVDRIIHQEEIEELANAISKLPEKQKDLLNFKYMLGMDDDNIAEILGIAPNSVRQYLTRARRSAKKIMVKEMN